MSLLACETLSFGVSEHSLCDALSLRVEAGECWGVLGPNGSGKTTLLKTLAGLHPMQSGAITLHDTPIQQLSRREIAQHLGLMLQDSHDQFPATVYETAMTGRHPHLKRWQGEGADDHRRVSDALETMQLSELAHRQVQTLSGGERRRLAFATLLTQASPLMLLDEPLNHLDLRHQQLLLRTVRKQCDEGLGAIMVLHEPNQAMQYCDRVLLLQQDSHWQSGRVDERLTAGTLSELYGCEIEALEKDGRFWFHYR